MPLKTQRRPPLLHQKLQMRKLLVMSGAGVLVLLMLGVSGAAEKIGDKVVFYVRVMRLYSEAPDTKIAMPLQAVAKKQTNNAWICGYNG